MKLRALYKGTVQTIVMTTVQNMGEIGEDRKHWWKVLWKMRNLKDRCRRDEGNPRGKVTTSHHKPGALAGQRMHGQEAMEGQNECQKFKAGGMG